MHLSRGPIRTVSCTRWCWRRHVLRHRVLQQCRVHALRLLILKAVFSITPLKASSNKLLVFFLHALAVWRLYWPLGPHFDAHRWTTGSSFCRSSILKFFFKPCHDTWPSTESSILQFQNSILETIGAKNWYRRNCNRIFATKSNQFLLRWREKNAKLKFLEKLLPWYRRLIHHVWERCLIC